MERRAGRRWLVWAAVYVAMYWTVTWQWLFPENRGLEPARVRAVSLPWRRR